MKRTLIVLAVASTAILGPGAGPALAQTRVFVSGHGDDGNPCSLSAPCRSFQQAHNTVAAGGEIVALDAAGYGTLAITKAVTVTAIGIEASITSNNTNQTAITINAGASDVVAIRGLTLFPGANAVSGIDIHSAKSVTIRDTTISGFPFEGIQVDPSANLDVELRDLSVNGNGDRGLVITPSGSGTLTMLVTDTTLAGNGASGISLNGGISTGTIKATFSVNAAANGGGINGGFGILVIGGSAQPVVMVTGSRLVNNVNGGLEAINTAASVFVDRTQITGNGGMGWFATGGAVVKSYTNNAVNGNGTDGLNGVTQITSE